jgi:hypothetical protein
MTEEQLKELHGYKRTYKRGEVKEIARRFRVSESWACRLRNGYVPKGLRSFLTASEKLQILLDHVAGLGYIKLEKKYGRSRSTIRSFLKKSK